MKEQYAVKTFFSLFVILSLVFVSFYLYLFFSNQTDPENSTFLLFTSLYGLIPLFGSMMGLLSAKIWNYNKSVVGFSILLFSAGLFLQFLGQATYTYYLNFLGIEPPYPSVADFAFIGSLLLYLFGAIELTKIANIKSSWQYSKLRIASAVIGIVVFIFAFYQFVANHDFESEPNLLYITLEIAYPLLQAMYTTVSIVCIFIVRNLFGGKVSRSILLILGGLISQYIADSFFLWTPRILTDGFYMFSYILISMGVCLFAVYIIDKTSKDYKA